MKPARWDHSRLVTDWKAEAWPVGGGWTVRYARWVRSDAGWDQEDVTMATPEVVTMEAGARTAAGIMNLRPDWVAEAVELRLAQA